MDRIVNRRDLAFQLYEVLDIEGLTKLKRFADHDRATFDAVIDTAEKIAIDKFASHAAKQDANEPTFDGEKVSMIPEVKEALNAYLEAGFHVAHRPEEEGGMGLPWTIAQACAGMFTGANASSVAYPFLTIAASNLLDVYGSQEQKGLFLKPMLDGRFFGTMCLSEPQAGSSLADIRTKADPQDDGSYRITGSKMWISGGDHELSENIVHLVLAKIPGGPAGTKGISLFIVPKFLVNADGSIGARNDVKLAGLNHKMGYRGTTNCLLSFGEDGGAVGYLVGKENQGLKAMFHMMNEARIGVGLGATMMGYAGYLYSLDYAKERPQGRLPDNRDPESAPVPIIQHADVRRMLLRQKSYVEGALLLCLYSARLVDEANATDDDRVRRRNGLLLDVLTPVVKAWPSDNCLEANKLAMQILGGYGYTRDYPLERLYRDNRLNPIHEGTNGIQSLDLLGRKVSMNNAAGLQALVDAMSEDLRRAKERERLEGYVEAFEQTVGLIIQTTQRLLTVAMEGDTRRFLANSHTYLEMMGTSIVAWMWLKQLLVAENRIDDASESDQAFYEGKLGAARYFFHHELPHVATMAALLTSLDTTVVDVPEAAF